MNHYDLIIIGTGAGGGTLAYRLAPSGKKILLLERGGFVPREKDNWESRAVNVEAKYHTREVWYDKEGQPLHPHTNYYVGGNTKFYGAALFRLRREDFGEIRHDEGVSPAWPLSYEDFEPYYAQAENLYHVHGNRGEDPTEPPASGPYPHPAVSHEPRIQQLHEDFARLGCKPFHVPLGVMLKENDPRSRCIRCATCDGYPCLVNAKSDAHVCAVEPALEYPNVTLLTDAMVSQLETSPSGGARVIQDLLPVMRELGLVAISWDGNFGNVQNLFDSSGKLLDEAYIRRIDNFLKELIWMARVLRYDRENVPLE